MGAAASGIAFALHETADRSLTKSLIVILGAVLAWSLSFAAGVINRRKVMQALKSNVLRNEAQVNGNQIAYDIAVEFIDKHKSGAFFFQEAQLWTLLAGAILYVSGHVWHLVEKRDSAATKVQASVASVRTPASVRDQAKKVVLRPLGTQSGSTN
jgi:hypothetical protein